MAGVEYNYAYNEQRDVTSYSEEKGTSTRVQMSCTYDKLNRPKKSSYKVNGKSYSYTCNYTNYPDEALASFVTPLGPVTYVRDGLNRLKERRLVGQCRTFTEMYEYLPNLKNGSYTTQLVKKLTYTGGTSRTLEYGYDANANIKTIKSGTSAVASYEYDGLNRLTRENINGEKTVVYGYDNAGNLTSKKEYAYTTGALGAVTATHSYQYASGSWGDRLTFYNGQCIKYNAAGYPTCYRGKQAIWTDGCLTTLGSTGFAYNDEGIRIGKGATEYFVKGSLILAEKRGSTVIHYYYDDSGVAGFEYNGQKYVYRKNLQGDIVAILDECGCTRGTYEYDAWGKIIWQGGSELLTINPFRYRGYYYDEETGLYYLNSRYYDPETGRFISPDSLKYLEPETCNGLNLYAYCGNNPVMFVDPTGHSLLAFIFAALLIAGGITGGIIMGKNAYDSGKNGWETAKAAILGAAIGVAVVGAVVSVFSAAAGALGFVAIMGIETIKLFAWGAIAFDVVALGIMPLFGIDMQPIEIGGDGEKYQYQSPMRNPMPKHPALP